MLFFLISVLAGVLTVLAPCILPLLPIVVGSSESGSRVISKRALTIVGSLSVSVIVFTLLLKATTLFISIPPAFWAIFSGVIIIVVGIALVFPTLWAKVPGLNKLQQVSNKAVGSGYQQKSYKGDMLIGLALGPVFTSCSPTYLFIIATVLPAAFLTGFIYLLGFTIGLAFSLLVIAYFGQQLTNKVSSNSKKASTIKKIFGVLIILVGIAILTGVDKQLETAILDSGYGATINFEESLIERFSPNQHTTDTPSINTEAEAHSNSQNNVTDDDAITASSSTEVITLAGGCFWCTEAYIQETPGVISAVSGYAGGTEETATYLQVSQGGTRHREAVQITFDPTIISTEEILDIYWAHIDPTDAEGQFADRGFHYTTAIYYHDTDQQMIAEDSKQRLSESGLFDDPIATTILPFDTFFVAEEYHQDYYLKATDHYEQYKKASGRAGFVEDTWAKDAALRFLSQ